MTENTLHGTTVALSNVLTMATDAGSKIIRKYYGEDATPAALRVAIRISRIVHDGADRPTTGGSAVKLNAILISLAGDGYRGDPAGAVDALRAAGEFSASTLMLAVLAVSRELADAAKRARDAAREERDALRKLHNDRSLPIEERAAAGMALLQADADELAGKREHAARNAADAIRAARTAGASCDDIARAILATLADADAVALAGALMSATATPVAA